jgi:hypothetical protein
MVEELVYFNYGVGALPAKRARMYCCSGYQITPEQGGTRFYSSFQRINKGAIPYSDPRKGSHSFAIWVS